MKTKKKLVGVLAAVGASCLLGGFCINGQANEAVAETKLLSSLFNSTTMQFNPEMLDKNNVYSKFGLEISGAENSTATINNSFSGEFSFEYLPIREYGDYTFQTLETTFTDQVNGNAFSIVVEQVNETYSISVELNGMRAGIYYLQYDRLNGQTRLSNKTGVYTELSAKGSLVIDFDPETMTVYASNGINDVLVWNMSSPINDEYDIGCSLESFNFYKVTYTMRDMGYSGKGIFMLYELNGIALDNYFITDGGAPIISCSVKEFGLVGEAYKLPVVGASNLIDGEMDVTKELYDPNGKRIRIYNDTFIPTSAGKYTLKCRSESSYGETVEKSYTIVVYAETPAYSYELDQKIPDKASVGEKLYISKMFLSGGLNASSNAMETTLTIYRNGTRMKAYTDVSGGFYYEIKAEGVYTLEYKAFDETEVFEIYTSKEAIRLDYDDAKIVYVGETVDFSDVALYVDGISRNYEIKVTYPSGAVYSNKRFETVEAGEYIIEASAVVENVTHTFSKKIIVYEQIADLFERDDSVLVDYSATKMTGEEGVRVRVTRSNTTVTYTQPIDLSGFVNQTKRASGGVIQIADNATPLIDMTVDAIGYNTVTTDSMLLRLTDTEDPTNFMEISIISNGHKNISYVKCRAGETNWGGFNNRGDKMTLNNAKGYLYTTSFGAEIDHTFAGVTYGMNSLSDSRIKLYYDNEEKQILAVQSNGTSHIIFDFDDKNYVTNGMLWSGFTADKAILSITSGRPRQGYLDCFIFNIAGNSFDDNYATYAQGPEIYVDSENVGALKGYYATLPTAYAKDYYGLAPKLFVEKVYYRKNGKAYDVDVCDGRFFVKYAGEYLIKYIAEDVFGNTTEKTISVTAREALSAINIAYSDELGEEYTRAKTGTATAIYALENLIVSNVVGEYGITCKVFDKQTQKEAEVSNGFVQFEASGIYTVRYTATDELARSATLEYDITVEKRNEVVIVGETPYYAGFVYGSEYELSDLYVKDYSSDNPSSRKAEIYVDGTLISNNICSFEYKTLDGNSATEKIDTVTLEYRYGDTLVKSYEIPVRTVYTKTVRYVGVNEIVKEELHIERFFQLEDGLTIRSANDSLILTSNDNNARGFFANKLTGKDVSLTFDIADARTGNLSAVSTNIHAVTVWLIDAADQSKVVKFKYAQQSSGSVQVEINDSSLSPVTAGSFDGTDLDIFTMRYMNTAQSLYDASGRLQKLTTYLDGREFHGFGSYVYIGVSVERENDALPASIKLMNLCGQGLSNVEADSVAPIVDVNGNCGGTYNVGQTVEIPSAEAFDVLSGLSRFVLTVTAIDADGNVSVMKDTQGVELLEVSPAQSYTIRLDKIASYKITYTATDAKGNEQNVVCIVNAVDLLDPVITVNGTLPATISLGTQLTLPSYTVDYVLDSEDNLSYIMCITPSDRHLYIEDGKLTFDEKGEYIVRYVAMDIYGNSTLKEFRIICK